MFRSSSQEKTTRKFQNLPRSLFLHTMDFCSTKEIVTQLRHVNKEWNGFTKEEFTLKKLDERLKNLAESCEAHPQHKNKKSLLNQMLLSLGNPNRDAVNNFLSYNKIPPEGWVGFRTLAD